MVGVITGAGSGFGRELSLQLAARGLSLGLCDLDRDACEETARLCRQAAARDYAASSEFLVVRCDVADADQVNAFADKVRRALAAEGGGVDFVAANAGIGSFGRFLDEKPETMEKVINVNLFGVMHTTRAFAPMLQQQKRGSCLMIVSSIAGVIAREDMSSYCTSKFAVRGFAEAFMMEMSAVSPHVQVTTVHPGFCATNIFSNTIVSQRGDPANHQTRSGGGGGRGGGEAAAGAAGESMLSKLAKVKAGNPTPQDLQSILSSASSHTAASGAEVMLRGVERGSTRILITPEAHVLDFAVRLAPRLHYSKAGQILTMLGVAVAKLVAPFTLLMKPGVPSPGYDRVLLALGAAVAAASFKARL